MEVTDVRIRKNPNQDSAVKGYASLTLNGSVVVSGVSVMEGKNGLFIKMPNYQNKNGDYIDIANPVTKEMRQTINKEVIDAYNGKTFENKAMPVNISSVQMNFISSDSNTASKATVTFDNEFAVHNIRLINGEHGMFAAMPAVKGKDGKYHDIVYPVTKELREQINSRIIEEYQIQSNKAQQHEIQVQQQHEPMTTEDEDRFINMVEENIDMGFQVSDEDMQMYNDIFADRKRMSEQFAQKIDREMTVYRTEIEKLPPDEIYQHAYEITMMNDFSMLLKSNCENGRLDIQFMKNEFSNDKTVGCIYSQWQEKGLDYTGTLEEFINDYEKGAFEEMDMEM